MLKTLKDAPPGRQLAAVALGAVLLCALLAAIWLLFLRTDYGILFSRLRAPDAATIVAELDKRKIPYRLEQGGTTILVPVDRVDSTRLAVMGEDLPLKGQVGFELFNKSDMGLTDFAQKINYQRALQGELARTIMTVESVDSARVHLSISEHSIFRDDRVLPKASVTLMPRPGHRITGPTVQGIQRLVAAAVPELEPGNVVVIDESGRVVGSDLGAEDGAEQPGRRGVEQHYEQEIRRAIAGIAPVDASISVWAGLPRGDRESLTPPSTSDSVGGARDFPLHVTIGLSAPVAKDVEDQIKASSLAALGPERPGDAVRVTLAAAGESDDPMPDPAAAMSPSREAPSATPMPTEISNLPLWASFGVVLVGLLVIVLRRRSSASALTEAERARFVSRFQTLLEQEQANV
jgi:flagellar M-ring protein FliF